MQVSVQQGEGLQRELIIEVPKNRLDDVIDKKIAELAKQVKLPGFQPNKPVPLRAVKQRFGADVREESQSQLMIQTFFDAIEQEKLEPAGEPKLEILVSPTNETFKFKAIFEVIPSVELKSLEGNKVIKHIVKVEDEDVQKTLDSLREQNRSWTSVDRPIANGDRVNLNFLGKIDGKELERAKADNYVIEMGTGMMIPGFEEGIIGKKAGDELVLNLQFPSDYHHNEIAGKDAEFDVKINTVEEGSLPELDDEFCKQFQVNEGGVEKLKENIRSNITRQGDDLALNKNKEAILGKLLELNPITAPNAMVDVELDRRIKMSSEMSGFAASPDQMSSVRQLMRPEVERSVQIGLLLRQLIQANEIKATEQDVRERVESIAENYEQPEEYINWFYTEKSRISEMEAAIVEDKAVELLYSQADVEEKPVTYQELANPGTNENE